MSKVLIFLIALVLLIGCDSNTSNALTSEQAVYESLFLEIIRDAHTKYYVVDTTESRWFAENPFNEKDWEGELTEMGGISISLVEKLYEENSTPSRLNWNPIITNAELIPVESVTSVDPSTMGERCWVERDTANIDVMLDGKFM